MRFLFCSILFLSFSQYSLAQNKEQSREFYTMLPVMPEFGDNTAEAMSTYFVENARLKCTKSRNENTHAVFVNVIIEKDGTPTFNGIARGEGNAYIKEAKRLIKKMPKWSIGRLNDGSPARMQYILPIWFVAKEQ